MGLFLATILLLGSIPGEPPAGPPEPAEEVAAPEDPLSKAPPLEQETIETLRGSLAWPRRVIAVLRLQRFDCPISAEMVRDALHDQHPAVRSFALLVLGHRGVPQRSRWLEAESDPTVVRTALRTGFEVDQDRLARGVGALGRSSRLEDKMLAAELALLAEDPELHEYATELVKIVVLRMSDHEAGALSPRLARITGGEDLRRAFKWRNWWKRNRLRPLDGARLLASRPMVEEATIDPTSPTRSNPADLSEVARMSLDEFVELSEHLERLALQPLDLAIVIDCTASMSGEIADAQGGVDDLMRFVGDVAGGIRVGVAGYRDRREKFEKVGWDFTPSIQDARGNLWRLNAEGGGDRPELVDQGLKLAYERFSWNPNHRGVLILVGDAPPHPGWGRACVDLARAARNRGVTTHVVGCDPSIEDVDEPKDDAETEDVELEIEDGPDRLKGVSRRRRSRERKAIEFFPEIAAAGGGRVVNLARDERLVPEIAGLVVGTDFEAPMIEFFQVYMALCR